MKNLTILFMLLIILASCNENKTKGEYGHGEQGEHAPHEDIPEGLVKISNSQMEVMEIKLGSFKRIPLSNNIKVSGQLELPPQNKASLSALIGGRVKSIHVFEGEFVKKGHILARLENMEYIQLQQEYLATKSDLNYLEKDYLRQKKLVKDSISSVKSFEKSEANYLKAKAQLNASKAELSLLNTNFTQLDQGNISTLLSIKAPIEGSVRLIDINIGSSVSAQQRMFEIVDNHHIHMGLLVYEKDIDEVFIDQKVIFTLSSHPEKVYEGKVFAVGKAFEEASKAVRVHAEIIGKPHELLPGMYINARIITSNDSVQALPKEAIVEKEGLNYIFIKKSQGKSVYVFEAIKVMLGKEDLGFVEVVPVNKINNSATIVTDGAYYLMAEKNKAELNHEH